MSYAVASNSTRGFPSTFNGNAFWEIKNGKKTRMVTSVTYNEFTTQFSANLRQVFPGFPIDVPTWEST